MDGGITARNRPWLAAACLLGVLALLGLLVTGRPPRPTLLWRELYNFGHVPLFGVIALLLLEGSWALLGSRASGRAPFYVVALVLAAGLGLATEWMQTDMRWRDADPVDALHNLAGAFSFLALRAVADGRLRAPGGLVTPGRRAALVLLGSLVLGLVLAPLGPVARAYAGRAAAFPVVFDAGADWQRPFLSPSRSSLRKTDTPSGWTDAPDDAVYALRFRDARWPGLTIVEPASDWRDFDVLKMHVYSEQPGPVELHLRIDDARHDQRHADRFNRKLVVQPGLNEYTVRLSDVRAGPRDRELELDRIDRIVLFVARPPAPFELLIGDLWLEKDG